MRKQEQTRYKICAMLLFGSGLINLIPLYQKFFKLYMNTYQFSELVACFLSLALVYLIIALVDRSIKILFPKLWSVMNNAQ